MDANAVLGPVDPQLGNMAAASILRVAEQKPVSEIDDQTVTKRKLNFYYDERPRTSCKQKK